MKKVSMTALVTAFILASFSVKSGELKQTITGGYANSNPKYMGYELDDGARGFNLKYRLEIDEQYGIITSYTKTDYDKSGTYGGINVDASLDYSSFMIGPTFRANEYFSVYLLAGGANGKVKVSSSSAGSAKETKTDFSYGGGLQIDITPNFVIDGSYEYTEFNDVKVGTWVVGVGFSF